MRIYNALPYTLQAYIASIRGAYLKWWRYGSNTENLVTRAVAREQWSAEEWNNYRCERLARVLEIAIRDVPYYRNHWSSRRAQGDQASSAYLENWPILEKETVRNAPRQFISQRSNTRYMFHEHTSGTTGKSLELWWSRSMVQDWYALFEARWRRWYGITRHDRWAILGGQLVTPVDRRQPPFWVWNAGLNQLYMSSYHLAPDLIPHYLNALVHHRVEYLWGYTSALYALAQEALRLGRKDLQMRVVVTNAEPMEEYQRQAISLAFQCPVRATYGMSEAVTATSECEAGTNHLWPEVGITEVVQGTEPVRQGQIGDIVATGLLNLEMPLIRYRLGDRGSLSSEETPCKCGRTLPMLASLEGRIDDILFTPDGRQIGRLDPIFKASLPVREAQIIQERLNQVRIRYVPTEEFTREAAISMVERLQARMGAVEVILEAVTEVPRTSNGKFRAVICNLTKEEKDSVRNKTIAKIQ